jgi:hypothetical protein
MVNQDVEFGHKIDRSTNEARLSHLSKALGCNKSRPRALELGKGFRDDPPTPNDKVSKYGRDVEYDLHATD